MWPLMQLTEQAQLVDVKARDGKAVFFGGLWRPVQELNYRKQMRWHQAGKSWYVVDGLLVYQADRIWAARKLAQGATGLFLDVGAYIGAWSKILAPQFTGTELFEPNPLLADVCKRNLEGISNANVHRVGVSNVQGKASLSFLEDKLMSGRVVPLAGETATEVDLTTIDKFELGKVGLLKIDVEGLEMEVLEGARRTIERDLPRVVLEQKHDQEGEQYKALIHLLRMGYVVHRVIAHDFFLYHRSDPPVKVHD